MAFISVMTFIKYQKREVVYGYSSGLQSIHQNLGGQDNDIIFLDYLIEQFFLGIGSWYVCNIIAVK